MSSAGIKNTPENRAREKIDALLVQSGWTVQDYGEMNLTLPAVAVREFKLSRGHGFADYLLFVDGVAVGVCEAKKVGVSVRNVEVQTQKYVEGLPPDLDAPHKPLPFAYISTGEETAFINLLDPRPRTREVWSFHRPDTMREWLSADTLDTWVRRGGHYTASDDTKPSTLRARLRAMPPVVLPGMWPNKVEAVTRIEKSLFDDRPRSLIQMATGSGKTLLAVTTLYRLIKFGGARRVLFLVDRANLGEQAEKEFQSFRTPDDQRKFTELYTVQRLTSNTLGSSSKVVISTIQRLYSVLKGEPELDPEAEAHTNFDSDDVTVKEPLPVVYNQAIPPEFFDIIFIDECHRSIYSLWRQVLEYFDAHLIGLTATPSAHTLGFFQRNLVAEYPYEQSVVDGVNVGFEVYRIRTRVGEQGGTVDASYHVPVRDRRTRALRYKQLDADLPYAKQDLDSSVTVPDQIRLVLRTFREKLFTELFPGRSGQWVPKTLIFAKDDNHAEEIVKACWEVFGQGNDFAKKITYQTSEKPKELIAAFRVDPFPRIAVTVDMIATGTDIKPVECLIFMRDVKSESYFEQMKGRGVRTLHDASLQQVTPDAQTKTRFVLIDAVGVTEGGKTVSQPMERKRTVPFDKLIDQIAQGRRDENAFSSLAARLAALNRQIDGEDRQRIE